MFELTEVNMGQDKLRVCVCVRVCVLYYKFLSRMGTLKMCLK